MGFIILLVVGAALGWLAAIVLRIEDTRRILVCIGLGSIGSVVGGIIASRESMLAGISLNALLISVVGAMVVLGLYGLFWNRMSNGDFR